MLKATLVATATLALMGCASVDDYQLYVAAQKSMVESQSQAEIARYNALKEIAQKGDVTAQVAAVISLNNNGNLSPKIPQLQRPESMGDTILKWTSVLLPSLTQFYSIEKNTELAITQSNNNRSISAHNMDSMVNMGRLISGQTAPVTGDSDTVLIYPEPQNNSNNNTVITN